MQRVMSTLQGICFKLSVWIGVVYLTTAVVRIILLTDSNKRVYNHTPGPCRILQGLTNGSAGIEFVEDVGLAFITSGLAIAQRKGGIGRILAYSFEEKNNTYEALPVKIERGSLHMRSFAPHGISAFVSKKRVNLYVVNAHPKRQCVEAFLYNQEKKVLTHQKSICDPKFTSISGIAAVGNDRFFVTNLSYFRKGWLQILELCFQTAFGSLIYYDGKNATYAEPYLHSPSGIVRDKKRRKLYVGSLLNEVIRVYDIDPAMEIHHQIDIGLLSSPAGISVEKKTGNLFVALHPVFHNAFLHWMNPEDEKYRSPSQVLRIRIQDDGVSWVITEPYANDGATISGSNDVIYHNDQILIGTMYDKALVCDITNPTIS